MDFNSNRVRASELYLTSQYPSLTTESPAQRRSAIFQEFVKLGMRERWKWHILAESHSFSDFSPQEKQVLEDCRTWKERSIAFWMSADDASKLVLMTTDPSTLELDDEEPEYRISGEPGWLYCEFEEEDGPFGTLPEIAYSLTMFDDPDDVQEAREKSLKEMDESKLAEPDQSLVVSGVFMMDGKVIWVDEYGETIREKRIDMGDMEEDVELFANYRLYETSWWLEATKIGKYAGRSWWV